MWKKKIFCTSPIVDSYGAAAIMNGATANIAGRQGQQHEPRRTRHRDPSSESDVRQSVITGSNVQSASVTNTTSNATSSASQNCAIAEIGRPAATAPPCREPRQ